MQVTQADNDLKQLIECRRTLSNVYKSQVNDGMLDNGNLSELNNAILNINQVIKFLESQQGVNEE